MSQRGGKLVAEAEETLERAGRWVGAVCLPWAIGRVCDGYTWFTACSMDTMASGLAAHIKEKVLCQL